MDINNPVDELRQMIEREQAQCTDSEVKFFYSDSRPVSVSAEAFFDFLRKQLQALQRSILSGETVHAVTSTIRFMAYMGAYKENRGVPRLIPEIRKFCAAHAGEGKYGHEGPLKQAVREVVQDGADGIDKVLEALEYHILVAEVLNDSIIYVKKDGSLKEVKLQAVKKAYREIISE